jgi:hypothetical protein
MEQMHQSSLDHFEVGSSSKETNARELVDVPLADRALLGLKATTALRRSFDMEHKLAKWPHTSHRPHAARLAES